MGFDDLVKENQVLKEKENLKLELSEQIFSKLKIYKMKYEQYQNTDNYLTKFKNIINDSFNEFHKYFETKGFNIKKEIVEISATLNQIGLNITLNQQDNNFTLWSSQNGYSKFQYTIEVKEINEHKKSSNVLILTTGELHYLNRQQDDIKALKNELELVNKDIEDLEGRLKSNQPINFILYWKEKEKQFPSIKSILNLIEEQHFN